MSTDNFFNDGKWSLLDEVAECQKCGDVSLPDPALDKLTIVRCEICHARYIRKHFMWNGEIQAGWVRLKWWQWV